MDIIERAARALTETLRHHGVEMHPNDIRGAAWDVIAALREPDEGMIDAYYEAEEKLQIDGLCNGLDANAVWPNLHSMKAKSLPLHPHE